MLVFPGQVWESGGSPDLAAQASECATVLAEVPSSGGEPVVEVSRGRGSSQNDGQQTDNRYILSRTDGYSNYGKSDFVVGVNRGKSTQVISSSGCGLEIIYSLNSGIFKLRLLRVHKSIFI